MKRGYLLFVLGLVFGMALMLLGQQLLQPSLSNDTVRVELEPDLVETPVPTPDVEAYPFAIVGVVYDSSENPVVGANVAATNQDTGEVFRVWTGADGRFEVRGIPLAVYSMEVVALGYYSESTHGTEPEGPDVEFELEASASLTGHVTMADAPVEGATVLVGGPGLFPARVTETDVAGRFAFDDLMSSTYVELIAMGEEQGSGFGLAINSRGAGELALQMVAAPAMIIEVRDGQTDIAIPTGVLSISRIDLNVLIVRQTFSEGRAEVRGFPPGEMQFRVRAPGYSNHSEKINHAGDPIQVSLVASTSESGSSQLLVPNVEP